MDRGMYEGPDGTREAHSYTATRPGRRDGAGERYSKKTIENFEAHRLVQALPFPSLVPLCLSFVCAGRIIRLWGNRLHGGGLNWVSTFCILRLSGLRDCAQY